MSKKVGIIGAMSVELELLKSKLEENPAVTKAGGMAFTEGKINGVSVVLVQSGVGKVNAALCAQRLILQFGCTHIINTGIAGAMASGLKVLDFVASTDAVYHDMDATGCGYKKTEIPQMKCSDFPADSKMLEAARAAFKEFPAEHKLVFGRIATGDQFVSYKEKKSAIQETCSPACVEMEGAAVAHACWINEIPFVIIRAISDKADDSAEMDYPTFERQAIIHSVRLTEEMVRRL